MVLVCFDLLHFAGLNLRGRAYADRHRYLAQCLCPRLTCSWCIPRRMPRSSTTPRSGLDSRASWPSDSTAPTTRGQRSRAWLKFKAAHSAEFVVGGYTRGKGARDPLGALLLGYYEGKVLHYAGHVGSGLDDASIAALLKRAAKLERPSSPFAEAPPLHRPTTWLKPELVAEVSFSEWTPSGSLRAPVFLRLRDDVAAAACASAEPAAPIRARTSRARRAARHRQSAGSQRRTDSGRGPRAAGEPGQWP